jgi:hypothetical protein
MRKFDLERALAGEPVITRDGRQVKELTRFYTCNQMESIVGTIDGMLNLFDGEGIHSTFKIADLFMDSEVIESWVNVYCRDGVLHIGTSYISEEQAKINGKNAPDYITTIKITNKS